LISTVNHELRTPLASLRGFTELLLTRDFPPQKQKEIFTILQTESLRLTRLVDNFLDLQRMESGRQSYQFVEIALGPFIRESMAVFISENGKHAWSTDIPDTLPLVRADADRIHQVLANLLSNAMKFSTTGGTISIGARQQDTTVLVWIADTGIGIPPEALPRLFEKFFRVENDDTRRIGGTGLGLALVKKIVEEHHGKVWVESTPNKGSTFFFTLPTVTNNP
jgi:signal transduction histidine kinase